MCLVGPVYWLVRMPQTGGWDAHVGRLRQPVPRHVCLAVAHGPPLQRLAPLRWLRCRWDWVKMWGAGIARQWLGSVRPHGPPGQQLSPSGLCGRWLCVELVDGEAGPAVPVDKSLASGPPERRVMGRLWIATQEMRSLGWAWGQRKRQAARPRVGWRHEGRDLSVRGPLGEAPGAKIAVWSSGGV